MSADVIEQTPRSRPRAVTLVAWLHIVEGLVLVAVGVFALVAAGQLPMPLAPDIPVSDGEVADLTVLGLLALALAVFALAIAVGLLRLRSWAWLVAMTLQGVSLAIGLVARAVGNPDELTLVLGIVVVMVLNQREVRDAFGHGGGRRV